MYIVHVYSIQCYTSVGGQLHCILLTNSYFSAGRTKLYSWLPVIRGQGKEGGVAWNLLELIGRVEHYRTGVVLNPLPHLTHCTMQCIY